MASKTELITKFAKAIQEGNAVVFAGAGLSRPSGYVDWKNLLRPLATEIGLDVDKENDLVAVAQFYRNERRNRGSINQTIVEAFSADVEVNDNVRILTRLPISTYWTTNYDHLLEEGLKESNRRSDVKINQDQLAITVPDRDAVIYKMHGDVRFPSDAVLTKDDYEIYESKRSLFRTALKGDLISKTFLFIGFSFEDPNLDYILSQIHSLIGENKRDHYCFLKKIERESGETEEDFSYRKVRQKLRVDDLGRYGIQAVIIDSYIEITELLNKIENAVKMNNIFVSGSADVFDSTWDKASAENLSYSLAKVLVKHNYRVTAGFGKRIGSSIINGALDEIYESKYKHIDEHLCLRPFPQNISDANKRKEYYTKYRMEIIEDVGTIIFMFGNKESKGKLIDAAGCLEEFRISKKKGKVIIPIGSTGYAAKTILEELKRDIDKYIYLKDELPVLENETDVTKIIEAIIRIMKKQRESSVII